MQSYDNLNFTGNICTLFYMLVYACSISAADDALRNQEICVVTIPVLIKPRARTLFSRQDDEISTHISGGWLIQILAAPSSTPSRPLQLSEIACVST